MRILANPEKNNLASEILSRKRMAQTPKAVPKRSSLRIQMKKSNIRDGLNLRERPPPPKRSRSHSAQPRLRRVAQMTLQKPGQSDNVPKKRGRKPKPKAEPAPKSIQQPKQAQKPKRQPKQAQKLKEQPKQAQKLKQQTKEAQKLKKQPKQAPESKPPQKKRGRKPGKKAEAKTKK